MLEDLCLEFSQWNLDGSDASKLRVCTLFHNQDFPEAGAEYLRY